MLFNDTILLDPLGHPDQQVMALIGIGHLPTTETDGHLDLVAGLKEANNVPDLDLEIMNIGPGPHLDLLDLDYGLFFLGLLGPFALLIFKFSVIHHLADRRTGMRGNLNQIKAPLFSIGQSLLGIDDPNLLCGIADEPDLGNPYLTIDSYFFSSYGEPPVYLAIPILFTTPSLLTHLLSGK